MNLGIVTEDFHHQTLGVRDRFVPAQAGGGSRRWKRAQKSHRLADGERAPAGVQEWLCHATVECEAKNGGGA